MATGPAKEVQQESQIDFLHKTGVAAAPRIREAAAKRSVSKAEPAADEPEAGKEGKGTAEAGRGEGRARAVDRAAAAKGRLGKMGTTSSLAEADDAPAAEAASAQPEHSEYSFPTDTETLDKPSVRFERAAAKATRLASTAAAQNESQQAAGDMPESMTGRKKRAEQSKAAASKGQKRMAAAPQVSKNTVSRAAGGVMEADGDGGPEQPEETPEEDLPRKTPRQGRNTLKATQVEAEAAPVSARPKRGSKRTSPAEVAAAKDDDLKGAREPKDVGEAAEKEEGAPEDPPKSTSAGPLRGKKRGAPAEESKGVFKTKERLRQEARTDSAADGKVPQAKDTVSRTTRAAQRRGQESEQAAAGTASTVQQAKRNTAKAPEAAIKADAKKAEPGIAESSAEQSARFTESQAAADTLAKVDHRFAQPCACHVYSTCMSLQVERLSLLRLSQQA